MDSPMCSIASTSALSNLANVASVRHPSLLSDLPENLIRAIFDHLTYNDVLRSHRVSKRLHKILRHSAHYLCRPSVSEMSVKIGLIEKRSRPLGRLQPISCRNSGNSRRHLSIAFSRRCTVTNKSKISKWKEFNEEEDLIGDEHEMSAHFLDALSENLKKVTVDGRLSFCGMAIDIGLYERLTRNWVRIRVRPPLTLVFYSNARDLVFTLCRFRLGAEQFRDLLSRTNSQKLHLELSQFDENILNDYVLEGMSECRELSASATLPRYYRGLTDRTLNRWATQECLPSRIYFHNVCANFTLDGVLTLINALQVKHAEMFTVGAASIPPSSSPRYEWNFGCIRLLEDGASILELMSLPGFVVHTTNNDLIPNVLDISLNVKHIFPLSFRQYNSSLPAISLQLAMNRYKTN